MRTNPVYDSKLLTAGSGDDIIGAFATTLGSSTATLQAPWITPFADFDKEIHGLRLARLLVFTVSWIAIELYLDWGCEMSSRSFVTQWVCCTATVVQGLLTFGPPVR
jgi:hypothetical protein